VARSKRTDRAEARRQYRAFLQAQAEAAAAPEEEREPEVEAEKPVAGRWRFPGARTATSGDEAAGTSSSVNDRSQPAPASGATGQRPMGFFSAMKAAYHPVHYRDDLQLLPTLLTRGYGIWLGVLLAVAGGVILINDADPNDFWFQVATMMLPPYPIIPASWPRGRRGSQAPWPASPRGSCCGS